ncbi:LYR motif-containing protein 4 isoform X3 [Dromaius novaehollandiae]|uniref:LYR motif-containing protein 4 isoform X3 n=1 Tax=Dromaius novaehollandiae TaxID=8790 RepID=UPI00311FE5B4
MNTWKGEQLQGRMYAIRRIRDAFRENKNIEDTEKIEELVNKAKANLEIIHRQVYLLILQWQGGKQMSIGYYWPTVFHAETGY